ncbi:MAG: thiol-disulfide oxidoreductase DCC family protein [Actinomycetes bacterium]
MSERRPRPVLLYDGACGFCTRSVEAAIARLDVDADYEPFQTADLTSLGVSRAEAAHSVQWVAPDGRIGHGSDAAARLLVANGGAWSLLGRLLLAPPASWVAEVVYRAVARSRHLLPGVTPALYRPAGERPRRR